MFDGNFEGIAIFQVLGETQNSYWKSRCNPMEGATMNTRYAIRKKQEVKDNMTLPKTLDYQTTLKPQSFRSTTNIMCRNDNNKCL
jgi:hypothetical protein